MVTFIVVNIGSINWLLPDGSKPLPEPTLTHLSSWGSMAFTCEQFHSQCLGCYSVYCVWKSLKYYHISHGTMSKLAHLFFSDNGLVHQRNQKSLKTNNDLSSIKILDWYWLLLQNIFASQTSPATYMIELYIESRVGQDAPSGQNGSWHKHVERLSNLCDQEIPQTVKGGVLPHPTLYTY